MNDDRNSGRHSLDRGAKGGEPHRPPGDEPRWPTGNEPGWDRPDAGRGRAQWRQPEAGGPGNGPPSGPGSRVPGAGGPDAKAPRWPAPQDPFGRRMPPPRRPERPRRPQVFDDEFATELLPPIDEDAYQVPREPELLTHRQHDHGGPDPQARSRINALASSGSAPVDADGDYDDDRLDEQEGTRSKWLRPRNLVLGFVGIFFVLPAIIFTVMYMFVDVPSPHEVAAAQSKTVTYYYADGTVLGQDFQDGNRVILKPDQIPDNVKQAVYAAEDATFETNSGFDVTGIARAVWKQATGGSGGGSTISQQYIKKATENEERTITRKATEIVKAFKMNNELSKSEIITAYLNTIYFGRGAYGIQAASQAYFQKDVDKLSESQAAFLAGIIQLPSRGDDPDYAQSRWNYVLDQMVANDWMSSTERAEQKFPKLANAEKTKLKGFSGPKRHIRDRVVEELEALGYPEGQVRAAGYKVYTTISRRGQDLAEKTVADVMKGEPEELKESLVAVDPKTGAIRAYYGGPYDKSSYRDWAATPRNPGSSFKPFDFVALLKQDKGPGEVYDGSSPREFGDVTIHNSEGAQCGSCTVAKAMEMSVNTVFYDMVVNDTTPRAVAEAAYQAGIPKKRGNNASFGVLDGNIAIGGGQITVSAREMAAAFATFAAEGIQRDSHFVKKVTTTEDEIIYQSKDEGKPAFDEDEEKSKQIAGNVTKVLEPVLPYSRRTCAGGRDCAGKTGTHQYEPPPGEPDNGDNSEAWMVGYTPSLSAAAWVGTGEHEPIREMTGGKIYGRGLPGALWQRFMDAYYEGKPNEEFADVEVIGKDVPPPPPPVVQKPVEEEVEEEEEPSDESKPNKPTKPTKPTSETVPPPSSEPTTPGRPEGPFPDDSGDPDED